MMEAVILDQVRDTLHLLDHGFLFSQLRVEWGKNLTRRLGDAFYIRGEMRIRFSTPLWSLATEAQRKEVVIHEVCHIVDMYRHKHESGYRRDGVHGKSWKRLMHLCGAEGARCHRVVRPPEMLRNVVRVTMVCSCSGRTFKFGPRRMAKVQRGYKYFCKICKATLRTKAEADAPVRVPLITLPRVPSLAEMLDAAKQLSEVNNPATASSNS